jgi:hypothetical protein
VIVAAVVPPQGVFIRHHGEERSAVVADALPNRASPVTRRTGAFSDLMPNQGEQAWLAGCAKSRGSPSAADATAEKLDQHPIWKLQGGTEITVLAVCLKAYPDMNRERFQL